MELRDDAAELSNSNHSVENKQLTQTGEVVDMDELKSFRRLHVIVDESERVHVPINILS